MWLTLREFLTVRNNPLKGPQPKIVMADEEAQLRAERNECISHVTHHYRDTQQLAEALEHLFFLLQKLRVIDSIHIISSHLLAVILIIGTTDYKFRIFSLLSERYLYL